MSIDTNVIYQVDNGKEQLKHLYDVICTTMPDPLCKIAELYIDRWSEKSWTLIDNELVGAGGFSFDLKDNIIIGYHMMKFTYFASQDEEARLLLDAFHYIAGVMGANRFITCQEITPTDGDSLDEIIQNLTTEVGQPAQSWDELYKSDVFKEKNWMVVNVL